MAASIASKYTPEHKIENDKPDKLELAEELIEAFHARDASKVVELLNAINEVPK